MNTTCRVDLDEAKIVDMVEGNRPTDLRRWFSAKDSHWHKTINVAAADLAEAIAEAWRAVCITPSLTRSPSLRAANRVVDNVRRRVQTRDAPPPGAEGTLPGQETAAVRSISAR